MNEPYTPPELCLLDIRLERGFAVSDYTEINVPEWTDYGEEEEL